MKKNRFLLLLTTLALLLPGGKAQAQRSAAAPSLTLSHTYEKEGFSLRTPDELNQILTPNFFQQPDWRFVEDIVYRGYQDNSVIGWTGTGETGDPIRRMLSITVPYVKYQSHPGLITPEAFAEALLENYPHDNFTKSAIQKDGVEGIEYRGEMVRRGRGQNASAAAQPIQVRVMVFRRGTEIFGVMAVNNDPTQEGVLNEMFDTIAFR